MLPAASTGLLLINSRLVYTIAIFKDDLRAALDHCFVSVHDGDGLISGDEDVRVISRVAAKRSL